MTDVPRMVKEVRRVDVELSAVFWVQWLCSIFVMRTRSKGENLDMNLSARILQVAELMVPLWAKAEVRPEDE